ncbi:MAG: hypothetical protein ACRCW6_01320 [Mycoplasmoidaceae bacterium]
MNLNQNLLFERKSKENGFLEYVEKIKPFLNYKNLTNFFWIKKKLFNSENYFFYERYVFLLIKLWAMEHEEYSDKYIKKLVRIIRKFKLEEHLFGIEKEYISLFKEIIFNAKRNLKNLVVDFPVFSEFNQKEEIFYILNNVNCISDRVNDMGDVFITSKRIVFSKEAVVFSIPYNEIVWYKLTNDGLELFAYSRKIFLNPHNDDPRVLYVSFERVYNGSY